jgi:hypothetical protein
MRLTFDIPEEQHEVLTRCLPHGIRKYAYQALVSGFVQQLEQDPMRVINALIEKRLDIAGLAVEGAADGSTRGEAGNLGDEPRRATPINSSSAGTEESQSKA